MNGRAYLAGILVIAAVSLAGLRFLGGDHAGDRDRESDFRYAGADGGSDRGSDRDANPGWREGRDTAATEELRQGRSAAGKRLGVPGRGGSPPSSAVKDSGSLSRPRVPIDRSIGGRTRDPEESDRLIGTDPDRVAGVDGQERPDRFAVPPNAAESTGNTLDRDGAIDAEQEEQAETLFDPLAPEVGMEVDRGADEDPLVVKKVDFLQDGSIYVGNDSVYTFPAIQNIDSDEGTIDMAIVPEWSGADGSDHSLLHVGASGQWKNRMRIVKNGESIRFMTFDDDGVERSINVRIPDWEAGQRHEITASWDAGEIRLFLDGELAGNRPLDGRIRFDGKSTIELGTPGGTQGPSATYEDLIVSSEPEYGSEY